MKKKNFEKKKKFFLEKKKKKKKKKSIFFFVQIRETMKLFVALAVLVAFAAAAAPAAASAPQAKATAPASQPLPFAAPAFYGFNPYVNPYAFAPQPQQQTGLPIYNRQAPFYHPALFPYAAYGPYAPYFTATNPLTNPAHPAWGHPALNPFHPVNNPLHPTNAFPAFPGY